LSLTSQLATARHGTSRVFSVWFQAEPGIWGRLTVDDSTSPDERSQRRQASLQRYEQDVAQRRAAAKVQSASVSKQAQQQQWDAERERKEAIQQLKEQALRDAQVAMNALIVSVPWGHHLLTTGSYACSSSLRCWIGSSKSASRFHHHCLRLPVQ